MKYWIFALCLGLSIIVNAQTPVKVGEENFEVKGERIFKDGKDITAIVPL